MKYLPQLSNIYGYIVINPYLSFSYIVTLSSLIGIPPLLGFYGKYYMIITGIYSGYLYSSIILIFVSGITAYYYSYIINLLTFKVFNNNNNNNNINIKDKENIQIYSNQYNNIRNQIMVLSYSICYIISLITFIILFPLLILDIYTNGSIILDFYQFML